jgi:hypothetical protein
VPIFPVNQQNVRGAVVRQGQVQLFSTEIARSVNRVTLEKIKGSEPPEVLTLLVNPSDITVSEASKNTPVETVTGGYVEEWGRGLGTISIQGITGFRKRVIPEAGIEMDGYTAFKRLRKFCQDYLDTVQNNRRPEVTPTPIELRIHFWEDDEHYIIVLEGPDAFKKMRSEARPLLYAYQISMRVIMEVKKFNDQALRQQASAYQRAQQALQAMRDSEIDIQRWLAIYDEKSAIGVVYKTIVDFHKEYTSVIGQAQTFLRQGTAFQSPIGNVPLNIYTLDLAADVATLANEARSFVVSQADGLVDDLVIGIARPMRRAACALQNLANVGTLQAQATGKVNEVVAVYSDLGSAQGC